ncbi:hypothetical protein Q3G72_009496 [Acer saccharum]|nr:hypothetical protein Q3G72_009496 [Acer saccharum]
MVVRPRRWDSGKGAPPLSHLSSLPEAPSLRRKKHLLAAGNCPPVPPRLWLRELPPNLIPSSCVASTGGLIASQILGLSLIHPYKQFILLLDQPMIKLLTALQICHGL